MTVIYRQEFTAADDTQVSSLSPSIGVNALLTVATLALVTGNRERLGPGSSNFVRTDAAESLGNDYVVKARVRLLSNTNTPELNIGGRMDSVNFGNNRYFARLSVADGVQLQKRVFGTTTTLATVAQSWTLNQDYDVWLVINGSSLSVWVDGTEVIAPVTDTSRTTGVAGWEHRHSAAGTAETGWHIDTFEVDDAFPPYGGGGNKFRPYFITG